MIKVEESDSSVQMETFTSTCSSGEQHGEISYVYGEREVAIFHRGNRNFVKNTGETVTEEIARW